MKRVKYNGNLWIVMAILILVTIVRGGQTNELYCYQSDLWVNQAYPDNTSAFLDATLRMGYDNYGITIFQGSGANTGPRFSSSRATDQFFGDALRFKQRKKT